MLPTRSGNDARRYDGAFMGKMYTPHPCDYRVNLDGFGDDGWEIMGGFAESPLAVVPFWPDDDGLASAEAEVNVRLMTAAPELLEVIEGCARSRPALRALPGW